MSFRCAVMHGGSTAVALVFCGIFAVRAEGQEQSAAAADARSDALGDPLPPDALLRMGTLRFRSPSVVKEISLTKDEKTLVTLGTWLTAWDAATGEELWRVRDSEIGLRLPTAYGVRALAMLADGQRFVTLGTGNQPLVWDARSGERETLELEPPLNNAPPSPIGGVYSVDVTRDGRLLAIGNATGLHVFDRDGQRLYTDGMELVHERDFNDRDRLKFGGSYSYAIFSPNNRILAVVDIRTPKEVRLLEAKTGKELRRIECTDRVVRMAFSPDSNRLAATERDTTVRLYDIASTELVWTFEPVVDKTIENYTSAIQFSPDGKWIAVAERNQQLYLLEARTGEEVARSKNHDWNPWALAFNADGSILYSSGWGGTIHRWNIPEMTQLSVPGGFHANSVVAASPAGDTCAYSDQAGNVHVINADDGTGVHSLNLPDAHYEYLEYSPDGKLLAGGGRCSQQVHVAVWDAESGELAHRWEWETGRDPQAGIEELRFSPDRKFLAAASFRQSAVHLLNPETGDEVERLEHSRVYGLTFSADGSTLLTAGWDSKIRFWTSSNGELQRTFEIPEGGRGDDLRMYTVCSEPSGELFATAHLSNAVRLWDAKSMDLRGQLQVSGRFSFGAMRFSPDGLWLAAGTSPGNIDIFEPWTGEKVHEISAHDDSIYMVGFGADNRSLYSGGAGVCYRWDLRPADMQSDGDFESLWGELAGSDSARAFRAWWALIDEGDGAVDLVQNKLLAIERSVDPIVFSLTEQPAERARRLSLLNKMVDSKEGTERTVTVRRAISVLSHIGTERAMEALQHVGEKGHAAVRRLAAEELIRRQRGREAMKSLSP